MKFFKGPLALLLTVAIAASGWSFSCTILGSPPAGRFTASGNLVKNADFQNRSGAVPTDFTLAGDVEFRSLADASHGGPWCLALQTGKDLNGDGVRRRVD